MKVIHINSDSWQQISDLYGIGEILAKRIIKYREVNGYFASPEELAKVEGVGLELAYTLAPQINWERPTKSTKRNEGQLLFLIFAILITLYNFYFIYAVQIPILIEDWNTYLFYQPGQLIVASIQGGLLSYKVFTSLCFLFLAMADMSTNFQFTRSCKKLSLIFLVCALFSVVLVVVSNVVYYQFLSPTGWEPFYMNTINLASAVYAAGFGLFVMFVVVSVWKPLLVTRSWFEWLFNISVLLCGFGAIAVTFSSASRFPGWALIINFLFGIVMLLFGWSIVTEKSILSAAIKEILRLWAPNADNDTSTNWQAWVNIRLPNPDDQKALRDALNKNYPPSVARSILSIVFISTGGWLMITTLASIIDWFVQRILNSWLP